MGKKKSSPSYLKTKDEWFVTNLDGSFTNVKDLRNINELGQDFLYNKKAKTFEVDMFVTRPKRTCFMLPEGLHISKGVNNDTKGNRSKNFLSKKNN